MLTDKLADYFLPAAMRRNKAHDRYDEFHVLTASFVIGLPLMGLFGLFLFFQGKLMLANFTCIWCFIALVVLFSIKYFAHYRIPMAMLALFAYVVTYWFIRETGLIYSPCMALVHVYLLAGIWTDKKRGWMFSVSNLVLIGYIYYQSIVQGLPARFSASFGNPGYALGMHVMFTITCALFLGYEQYVQEKNRRQVKDMQDQQITLLDETVKKRTEQLNNMRHVLAADFHDYTGNALSAIIRQASLLKTHSQAYPAMLPMVESIIQNGNDLYASSRDFLWNLNHDSDDAAELFDYLTSYGQTFYNHFDISFSSHRSVRQDELCPLDPFAALNLIFIFKEAMTNVVKHSAASEVELSMASQPEGIVYALVDNGKWRQVNNEAEHYGLRNIRNRSLKSNFKFTLSTRDSSTRIEVAVPYSTSDSNNATLYAQQDHHH